jgi:hypothetical protein
VEVLSLLGGLNLGEILSSTEESGSDPQPVALGESESDDRLAITDRRKGRKGHY